MNRSTRPWSPWLAAALALVALAPAAARAQSTTADELAERLSTKFGLSADDIKAAYPEYFRPAGSGRNEPLAVPNIFRSGDVLNVGKVVMKITNLGLDGNPFTNLTSDASGQWPGQSGIEYMNAIAFAVGAVNPTASDPNSVRRVSYFSEWRPKTLQPEDDIYPAYDGVINGVRFSNDDGDFDEFGKAKIDEDFLNGRDDDGDDRIDEDYAALGQKMLSCSIWDNTIEATSLAQAEKHVPRGLEVRKKAWAYSLVQYENFNVIEYEIFNRSGQTLDSVYVGWLVDMDAGPNDVQGYWSDDLDNPAFPNGEFILEFANGDRRRQEFHDPSLPVPQNSPLCTWMPIRINGFSVLDDNGDEGRTTGVPSFLLVDHTVDPLGVTGPRKVGFRSFRSYTGGTPYTQGGGPTIDQQRFEFMSSGENVAIGDNEIGVADSGFIRKEPGDQKGDFVQWASVGPWLNLANNQSIKVTIAFAVQRGTYLGTVNYKSDYEAYWRARGPRNGPLAPGIAAQNALFTKYPALKNAYDAMVAFEGIWEQRDAYENTTCHGCETPVTVAFTEPTRFVSNPCDPDVPPTQVTPGTTRWFDLDCDYCTGVFDYARGAGLFHKTWNASAPPPNPVTNVSTSYNYTDNPDRRVAPAADNAVVLAWDNLSEVTPDPGDTEVLDFRGYRVWKVANWTRPVGSPGPAEEEWALVGEFRQFNYYDAARRPIPNNRIRIVTAGGETTFVCPKVFIPQRNDSVEICLERFDLWDRQSGLIIKPAPESELPCVGYPNCEFGVGCKLPRPSTSANCFPDTIVRYPVGRYRLVDREVKNGFTYFYSVTAFDSVGGGSPESEGRRSAVEAEGVTPQAGTRTGKGVWVVPNPYKGFLNINQRPSTWDLTPNATDPTGTHIDFMGLPPGRWTIRIYTVSGDLVQELHSGDPVNESLRTTVTRDDGSQLPGYNRQQDTPYDGQARWNLISRNGQDIVSGIYMFTVESSEGTQVGKFVVIR
uniref:T9SS type A sorting domain-containing protein n=1 Tax=Eiseniibacteriota bacterium TaxID=2212470 RepID=A0A832MIQ5_UNCEI